jgi:glutamate N-acetyltransferase/amino-acid N-acetyltransferase
MADDLPISPLAPKKQPVLPPIAGVRLGAVEAGIKYRGRTDLAAIVFDEDVVCAGVFTKSACASAPVEWCRELLSGVENPRARTAIINSGNANAFTGKAGAEAARMSADAAAQVFDCKPENVLLASTGVIGEPLDASAFANHLQNIALAAENWDDAAKAIMTTDTYPKQVSRKVDLGDGEVTINGIAKGSGMIAPDMATMLAFLVTDAPISADLLQNELKSATDTTFNAITVDSDTSTSDTILAFATGKAGRSGSKIDPDLSKIPPAPLQNTNDPRLKAFRTAFHGVLHDLALLTVRDGEGATKLVEVRVEGAVSEPSAKRIAMSIANSPLVKTAIAGEDANWGRVVMAVGKAGEPADRDKLAIWFGDVRVAAEGARDPDYDEDTASAVMRGQEILLRVDIGLGNGAFTAWTCDLTKQYVAINGDYRS